MPVKMMLKIDGNIIPPTEFIGHGINENIRLKKHNVYNVFQCLAHNRNSTKDLFLEPTTKKKSTG